MLQEQTLIKQPFKLGQTQENFGGIDFPFSITDFIPGIIKQSEQPNDGSSKKEIVNEPHLKEIPNPEKDKLIVILNFILKEVIPIQDPQKQKELLIYFFRSILSETQKLPVTHLAYEITKKQTGELALHDDVYLMRPDLLQICQEAVESIAISSAEKDRYHLEKLQIENLLMALEQIFTLAPHAVMNLLAETKKEETQQNSKIIRQQLEQTGWESLSPDQAFEFIQPEVREKMKLANMTGEITIGPKYLYIMPQSAVHEGNLSIIVIAQPIFIPEINRFILLHDQHMTSQNWNDHQKLFKGLGEDIPENFDSLPFEEKEKFIMDKLVMLPKKFQNIDASSSFLKLFPEKKFFKRLRQKLTRKKIQQMEPALEQYSQLLIDVVKNETRKDPNLSSDTVIRLSNFLKRVIFAGILDTKKISSRKRQSLFDHFRNFGNLSENEFALSLKGIGFSSATKAFDTSLLECVALSPMSSVQQLMTLQMDGVQLNSISKVDLAKFIGEKRAKEWKIGSCLKCGAHNTWIGECNWCLNCEMSYDFHSQNSSGLTQKSRPSQKPIIKNKKIKKDNISSENLGSFVANLI